MYAGYIPKAYIQFFFQASSLRTPKIGSPDIKCLLKR